MDQIIQIFDIIFYCLLGLSFIFLLYKFIYGAVAFGKTKEFPNAKVDHKYCILIPARNESKVIKGLLQSILAQDYDMSKVSTYVIVESENDPTCEICKDAGVNVFVRKKLNLKGKGYALHEAIDYIQNDLKEEFDAFFIFDADNIISKNYIKEMNKAYDAGYKMALGYRNSKNWNDGWIASLSALTFSMLNTFQNKARAKYGFNILVSGTGFYIDYNIIKENGGWTFFTLTEDVELSMYSTLNNIPTTYVEKAEFFDEQPTKFKQSWNQRIRWVKGYQQVHKIYDKKLIKSAFTEKENIWTKIEYSLQIMPILIFVLTIAFYSISSLTLCIINGIIGNVVWIELLLRLIIVLCSTYLFLSLYTLLLIIAERKKINLTLPNAIISVLMGPIFMFLYIPIALKAFSQKEVEWKVIEHSVVIKEISN